MKLRGSTQFYLTCALHIAPFCGTHPPTTRLGVITVQASVLRYWRGHWLKKVLVSLLDAEGWKNQLTKTQGKDLVILIYNRKYVLLWDVLQHRLWVIRKFFLKRNLDLSHSSASHFTEIPLIVCGSSQKDGNSLQTLNSCPNPQEKHIDLLYIEGKDAVLYKN